MISSVKTDSNYRSHYGVDGLDISEDLTTIPNITDVDAVLKLSHSSNLAGLCQVAQGAENAVDINVCRKVDLSGRFGGQQQLGDQVITIKGGSSDVLITGCIVSEETSSGIDVDVGNHSDQSRALTRRVSLHLFRENNAPVRVRIGWALPFSVQLHGGCRYLFWASLKLKVYVLAKLIIRFVLRIPPGTKGPSWF